MPAVSAKQERFMQAVANNPKFAKKVGVPQSIGKEFTMKKPAKKAAKKPMMEAGGVTKEMPTAKQMGSLGLKKGGMTKMGAVKTASKPDGVIKKGATKGKMVKMAYGGKACK